MFDSYVIERLLDELRPVLLGNRIQKIWMSEAARLFLKIKTDQFLEIDLHPQNYHLAMVSERPDLNFDQSAQVQVLRCYLESAKILSLEQIGFDRTVEVKLQTTNQLFERIQISLYIEFMGKHSNLIVTDELSQTLFALKYSSQNAEHVVRNHSLYHPLISEKPIASDSLELFQQDTALGYKGFHKKLTRLLPESVKKERMIDVHRFLMESQDFRLYFQGQDVSDYHVFSNPQFSSEAFETLNEAVLAYYARRVTPQTGSSAQKDYLHLLKSRIHQLEVKREKLESTREEFLGADIYRKYGDLIYANLYHMKSGLKEYETLDYETDQLIIIPLDARKSPVQNAVAFHQRYQKQVRGQIFVTQQLDEAGAILDHLYQLLFDLEQAKTEGELEEIRSELVELGLIRHRTQRKPQKASSPHRFTYQGLLYQVGKNSRQNEELSIRSKNRDFVWFHAKDIPGSHVVASSPLLALSEDQLQFGAMLAAYYSKAKGSSKIPVDYTDLSHVKKPKGQPTGFVNYTNQRTLFVTPEAALIEEHRQEENETKTKGLR